MTTIATPRQAPLRARIVYWSERVGGWWRDLSTRCPACGGNMGADPPDGHMGRVYCLACNREVADVLDMPRTHLGPEEAHPRRGRPRLPCTSCRINLRAPGCLICYPCNNARQKARAAVKP